MLKTQEIPERGLILALDNIQDPGNLGTIVRLADWFNVKHIVCNSNTVDLYNPKCIQATMGSIARVQLHYVELETFLNDTQLPIFVTAMSEQSIYEVNLPTDAMLVMGSESHGVSNEIMQLGTKISIPQYSAEGSRTESLNVATATGIVLAEWRRSTGM